MVMEAADQNRPYAPPSNVISVLQRLRSRNLPDRIDADYLRDANVPEGTVSRTLFGLRFLDLIGEGGVPTRALRSIHTSTDEEYREILAGLIREAYAEVFNVINPAEDPQDRIVNVFRRYAPASQRQRMVIFFLGMCREAGIPTLDVPRQRSMAGGTPRPAQRQAQRQPARQQAGAGDGGGQGRQRGGGGAGAGVGIPPALDGLMRSLPAPGTPLSAARRNQWIEMARATLAFVYPDEAATQSAGVQGEEDGNSQ